MVFYINIIIKHCIILEVKITEESFENPPQKQIIINRIIRGLVADVREIILQRRGHPASDGVMMMLEWKGD